MAKDPGQKLLVADGQPFDLDRVDLATLNLIQRSTQLQCPRCQGPLRLQITEVGPLAMHRAKVAHEPEDYQSYVQRQALQQRLQQMFAGSVVSTDVNIGREIDSSDLFADIAVISPQGARLLIFLLGRSEHSKKELHELKQSLHLHGLHGLWILDGSRIDKRPEETKVMSVGLKKTETALLSAAQPLLYLGPENKTIYRVYVHSSLPKLASQDSVNSLGRVKTAVRKYRIDQLRIINGQWVTEDRYSKPLPAPPPLPERLLKKMPAQWLS